jgi:hypothetical protein
MYNIHTALLRDIVYAYKKTNVADPDPGSVAFDPWIRDGKISGFVSGIRIWDEQPRSYFRELRNNFLVEYLNSLMRIRDGKNSDPGSEINIPDPQH